jgi:hypothetical protein
MTAVFATRRRAEEFAALVESRSAGDPGDPRYDDLLRLVGTLRETSPATPRAEFVAGLRARLMTAADTALVPAAATQAPGETERLTLPARRPARERRIAAAVGGLALVGATTSMAMAAQDALPGDVLYPVKRAIENVRTGIQLGEGDKGVTLLANASGRLEEVGALSEDASDTDAVEIAATLGVFTDQASEASDLLLAEYAQSGDSASISELRDFTGESLEQLAALEPQVPDAARDELVGAARLLVRIDAAAQAACPICAGSGVTEIPRIFAPAAARFTVPEASVEAQPARQEPRGARKQQGDRTDDAPAVPAVDPGKLPSGSVLQPSPAPAPNGGQQSSPPPQQQDPLGALADELASGGSTQTSTPATPTKPDLGDVGDAAGEVADDVTKGAKGVTDGVGDAVAPVTGKVLP